MKKGRGFRRVLSSKSGDTQAWMISSLGEAVPVPKETGVHIYGSEDDLDENVYAAAWLYSQNPSWGSFFKKVFTNWAAKLLDQWFESQTRVRQQELIDLGTKVDWISVLEQAYKEIWKNVKILGYDWITPGELLQFVDTSEWEFLNLQDFYDENYVGSEVSSFLNSHYLRVCYGGKYDPDGEDKIYFRISSKGGVNWRPIIEDFIWDTFKTVNDMPEEIWIGNDYESKGNENVYVDAATAEYFGDEEWYSNKVFSCFKQKKEELQRVCSGKMNSRRLEMRQEKLERWQEDAVKFDGNLKFSIM